MVIHLTQSLGKSSTFDGSVDEVHEIKRGINCIESVKFTWKSIEIAP